MALDFKHIINSFANTRTILYDIRFRNLIIYSINTLNFKLNNFNVL